MKEQLIDEILQVLQVMTTQNALSPEQIVELKYIMHLKLENYEVTKKCTELAVDNTDYMSYLIKFLAAKIMEGRSERTIEQYKTHISLMLQTIRKPIKEITTDDLFLYFAKYKGQRHLKNSSLDHKRRVVNSFFTWLAKKKHICENPALGLEKIKVEKVLRKPFTDEERERLRCACQYERDLAIIELLYSTGMRVSELTKLNRSDIKPKDNSITVLGKGNKEREVYMNASARLHLENYLENRTDDCPALFIGIRKGGERLSKNAVEKILKKLGELAGVENVHPHRYRRTTITNALNRGMPVQEVQVMAGHTDLNTTMVYFVANNENIKHSCSIYLAA